MNERRSKFKLATMGSYANPIFAVSSKTNVSHALSLRNRLPTVQDYWLGTHCRAAKCHCSAHGYVGCFRPKHCIECNDASLARLFAGVFDLK